MPIFTYNCTAHGAFHKMLATRNKEHPCPQCGESSKNVFKVGTVQSVERLDNGLMARAVERLTDIEEIVAADNASSEAREDRAAGIEETDD